MRAVSTLDAALRRDRRLVVAGLVATTGIAWAYQVLMAWGMERMSPAMAALMPNMQLWRARDLLLLLAMWVVMMAAMMVPTAAPAVLVFAHLQRTRGAARPVVATAVFLSGYLAAWAGFSLLATLAQWRLHEAAIVSAAMETTMPLVAGALLVATGLFQWTPWKDACLSRCRSPLSFLLNHGRAGPFRAGLLHGAYCVGCCALLMLLLFVNGVMNLAWMAFLTAFVLVEKLLPAPRWTARVAGCALCAWGVWVVLAR